jgi:hypothetical protein
MKSQNTLVDVLLKKIRDNEKVPLLSDYEYGEILSQAYKAYHVKYPDVGRGKARGGQHESFGKYASHKTGLHADTVMEYKRRYEAVSILPESKYKVVHLLGYSTLAKLASPKKPSKLEKSQLLKDAEKSRIEMVKEGYSRSAIKEQVNRDITKRLAQINKQYDKHGTLKNFEDMVIDFTMDEYGYPTITGDFLVYLEWIQLHLPKLREALNRHSSRVAAEFGIDLNKIMEVARAHKNVREAISSDREKRKPLTDTALKSVTGYLEMVVQTKEQLKAVKDEIHEFLQPREPLSLKSMGS